MAASFVGEKNVVVAKLDADTHRVAPGKYSVTGYPTIMWFPRNNKAGEPYNLDRSPESFVKFINDRSGTKRKRGGGFDESAGRVAELDELASKFVSESSAEARKAVLSETEQVAERRAENE